MAASSIEERLAAVEKELSQLKQVLAADKPPPALPWWEEIRGTFKNDPAYREAMRLGREWRESHRPENDLDMES